MITYRIEDAEIGETLIEESIDYACKADEREEAEMSDLDFLRRHCLDGMTALRIFLAKFFPSADFDHGFQNGLVDTCGDRSANAICTGSDSFEVRAFGQVVKCQLVRD